MPDQFSAALEALRRARCRPEVALSEIPAPARLAPHAVALGAEIMDSTAGGEVLATGRFILLHDPSAPDVWEGTFRIVTFIRAQLDADMGNDQLLGSVAWTWLVEALEEHDAGYRSAGGTATRVLSEGYGTLSGGDSIDIELRASWTPEGMGVQPHLEAWSDMVCAFAGLPPLPEGVTMLPGRRLT